MPKLLSLNGPMWKLNSNIRCIEIKEMGRMLYITDWLNSNIRCIEIEIVSLVADVTVVE